GPSRRRSFLGAASWQQPVRRRLGGGCWWGDTRFHHDRSVARTPRRIFQRDRAAVEPGNLHVDRDRLDILAVRPECRRASPGAVRTDEPDRRDLACGNRWQVVEQDEGLFSI